MKILFIAPLPPPVSGHSVASAVLLRDLARIHEPMVVDLSRDSLHDGTVTAKRLRAVAGSLVDVARGRGRADAVYLTISESIAGNLKDLFIYALCVGQLSRTCVHLHGGTIGRELFARRPALRRLNRFFLGRLGAVIVSGPSHLGIFAGMVDSRRLHVVPNFAPDELFVATTDVPAKFAATSPLRVLYVSGMTDFKGYQVLADAFEALPPSVRSHLRIDFAGRFDDAATEAGFRARIARAPELAYHGVVTDAEKRALFAAAHVFCLPTAHFEGQPISILEAYASGCAVIATGPAGIRDIFTHDVNGLEITPRDPASLAAALRRAVESPALLRDMAVRNRDLAADRYRTSTYAAAVRRILEGLARRGDN